MIYAFTREPFLKALPGTGPRQIIIQITSSKISNQILDSNIHALGSTREA